MQDLSSNLATYSQHACHPCKRAKRRCDRSFPRCSLCNQRGIACDYPYRRKERERRRTDADQSISPFGESGEKRDAGHHGLFEWDTSELLAVHFLDPDIFSQMRLEVGKIHVTTPKLVDGLVGSISDIHATANIHFDAVHTWMPIVSKQLFFEHLPNRLFQRRAELYLLTLSMKLCSTLGVTTPRTVLYRAVKELYFDIETSGVLSIQVLQSGILIALYEMGHAMYPACLLSIANCARYGTALGINETVNGTAVRQVPWIEEEEYRRVWWAIVILDRFANLCDPGRQLVTPNPTTTTYLPVDDTAWDEGTSRPEHAFTIGSSSGFHLGRFARFAQVAYLLTQALEQAAEEPSANPQLQRTIIALVNLSNIEGHLRRWVFCTQMAVCHSAILLLENRRWSPNNDNAKTSGLSAVPISAEVTVAMEAAFDMITYLFVDSGDPPRDRSSPFLPHFLYSTGRMYLRIAEGMKDGLSHTSDKLSVLKQALRGLNNRWLVAGVYLSLLERREVLLQIYNDSK
ncbi:hypothetical protein F5884DRAFT_796092 [Xylogone sp. PMI_703]|nr:hypothetical protein F5884DRAFT_796092 [Xylogone sp. PMI_703]